MDKHPIPSLENLAAAARGKIARDGETVVVSLGSNGFLRLRPTWVIVGDAEVPAAKIEANVRAGRGRLHAEMRDRLRIAGIYPL